MTPDPTPVPIAVTGATGRMGQTVIETASERQDCTVALAVSHSADDVDEVAGVPVRDAADLPSLLTVYDPAVLVDFTVPDATTTYVEACVESDVAAVIGTTGFDHGGTECLRTASESVGLLKAANFARGVAALRRAVREAVGTLPGYDVEVTETHHNGKRDAPSGTAKTIVSDIEAVRSGDDSDAGDSRTEGNSDERVHGREGIQPRDPGEIGIHARRAGDVTGEHEVLMADNHELVAVTHRAESRGVFAAGALDAAVWLADRPAGWYTFTDVIEDER